MTDTLSICLAQLNPVVGNVEANIARARSARAEAAAKGADLIVFTELFVSGGAEHQGPDGGGPAALIYDAEKGPDQ